MPAKSDIICGIESGAEAVSVVQYSPELKAVSAIAIQPIDSGGGDWWENLDEGLSSLVDNLKLSNQIVVCSLPAERAVLKSLAIDVDEEQVDEALQWELSQHIVGSMDDYNYDFVRLDGASGDELERYLAVAYRGETVSRLAETLRSHKLKPLVVDLDMLALLNVFEVNYSERMSAPAFLVLGGMMYTKIALVWNGTLVDHEVIREQSEGLDAAQYSAKLNETVDTLTRLNPALSQQEKPSVYLSGPLFSPGEFCSHCLGAVEKTEVLSPFRAISCRTVSEEDLQKYAPQLAVAVGLAVRGSAELEP